MKIGYFYILGGILLMVYSQLVLKWQISQGGALPPALVHKIIFLLRLFVNGWILSVFAAGFFAALLWMAALTRFELSYAYPFVSLSFVLVLGLSTVFFHETINGPKILGMALIVAGVVVSSWR